MVMFGDNEMKVTVKKDELLKRLKDNRRNHIKVYKESLKLWQKDLAKATKEIKASDYVGFPRILTEIERDCPTTHEAEYDRVIDMFSMSMKDEIELSGDMFNTYCRDEWGWKSSVMSNKYYSMSVSN